MLVKGLVGVKWAIMRDGRSASNQPRTRNVVCYFQVTIGFPLVLLLTRPSSKFGVARGPFRKFM